MASKSNKKFLVSVSFFVEAETETDAVNTTQEFVTHANSYLQAYFDDYKAIQEITVVDSEEEG